MDLTGKIIVDDDACFFEFKIANNGVNTKIVLFEPYIRSEDDWMQLINAIRNKTPYHLPLYQGNGEGEIASDGVNLVFTSMCSGAGGDVSIEISLPLNDQQADLFLSLIKTPEMQALLPQALKPEYLK